MRMRRLTRALVVGLLVLAGGTAAGQDTELTGENVQVLIGKLEKGDHWKVRLQACRALGMLRREEAIPAIVQALRKDPDQLVRKACAFALGAVNHPGVLAELTRAAAGDVPVVQEQAERAVSHILSSFPSNLPGRGKGKYHISIDDLKDRATRDKELTTWIQQYFLERMLAPELNGAIDPATPMDIEEGGELPDVPEDYMPVVQLTMSGGVERAREPAGRRAGTVEVGIAVELELEPGGVTALAKKSYAGSAAFAGGARASDPWVDDPLLESQKAALKIAVGLAFDDVARFLKLE